MLQPSEGLARMVRSRAGCVKLRVVSSLWGNMKRSFLGLFLILIAQPASAGEYWYYCDPAHAYYPYVSTLAADQMPRSTPGGIPIEKDAVLSDKSQKTLSFIDAIVSVVRFNGYHCDSISGFHPYVFSLGVELTCNRFSYTYDFEDKGRGLQFKPPD